MKEVVGVALVGLLGCNHETPPRTGAEASAGRSVQPARDVEHRADPVTSSASICLNLDAHPQRCDFPSLKNLPENWQAEVVVAEGASLHAVGRVHESGEVPSTSILALHATVEDGALVWQPKERWPRGESLGINDISSEHLLFQERGGPLELVHRPSGVRHAVAAGNMHWAGLSEGFVAYASYREDGQVEIAVMADEGLDGSKGAAPRLLGETSRTSVPVLYDDEIYFARSLSGEGHSDRCGGARPYIAVLRAQSFPKQSLEKQVADVTPLPPSEIVEFRGFTRHGEEEAYLLGVEEGQEQCGKIAAPQEAKEPPYIGAERPAGFNRSCVPRRDIDVALAIHDADGAERTVRFGSEAIDSPRSLVPGLKPSSYWVSWCAMGPSDRMGAGRPYCYLARLEGGGAQWQVADTCAVPGRPYELVRTTTGVFAYSSDVHGPIVLEHPENLR